MKNNNSALLWIPFIICLVLILPLQSDSSEIANIKRQHIDNAIEKQQKKQTPISNEETVLAKISDENQVISSEIATIKKIISRIETKIEKPALWKRVGESILSSFVYDLISKTESKSSRVAKLTSFLGFIFLVLKVFVYISEKRQANETHSNWFSRVVNNGANFYIFFMATILLLISTTGSVVKPVTSNEIDDLVSSISDVQDDISNYNNLISKNNINLEKINNTASILSTAIVNIDSTTSPSTNINDQNQLNELEKRQTMLLKKIDLVKNELSGLKRDSNFIKSEFATDGIQYLTFLLVLFVSGVVGYVIIKDNK